MSEIIEMEARIKDYVSRNIAKIEERIKKLGDTSTTSTKKMSSSFASLRTTVKGLATAVTSLFVFRKVSNLVSESIRLSKIQIDAEQRLSAVLKSTAESAGVTFGEMTKLASSLQNVTTVGDETIIRGEAMLLTFTNIGKEVLPQATEAMLNLSIAMRTDVQQASIQLGKALNDPVQGVTALRRVGIQLTDQQEEQIKKFVDINDTASAQKVILGELETQFGGLAREVAKTDPGKIEQLKNKIGDLKEDLGNNLLPITREWYELLLKISNIALPSLSNTIIGWDWLFGGKEKSEKKLNKSKTIHSLLNDLITLQNALKDAENAAENAGEDFATISDIGEYLPHTVGAARHEIELLKKDIADLGVNFPSGGEKGKKGKPIPQFETYAKSAVVEKEKPIPQLETYAKSIESDIGNLEEGLKAITQIEKEFTDERIEMYTAAGEIIYDVAPTDRYYDKLREKSVKWDEQVLEARKTLTEAKIELITDEFDQELAMLDLMYKEEQAKYENNQIALAAIKEKYELKQEAIEKKRASKAIANQKQELSNQRERIETGVDYTIDALDIVAKANKENSALQKGIDIAQATANTYKGATKALSEGREWEVPFIIALGLANVALIASQKYSTGGIVPGNTTTGDRVPAFLNSREGVFTVEDQRLLYQAIRNPSTVDNSNSISLNINLSGGSTYDMAAAQYTVDQLVPVLGDALVRAKNEGRLREYETAR